MLVKYVSKTMNFVTSALFYNTEVTICYSSCNINYVQASFFVVSLQNLINIIPLNMKHLLTQWQMAVKWSIALFASLCCLLFWGCKQATHFQMQLEHMNELESIIYVEGQAKILLLPIQESADESLLQIESGDGNKIMQTLDVHMAVDSIDYFVPLDLDNYRQGSGETIMIRMKGLYNNAVTWDAIELVDTFDTTNRETFRPIYHHTPLYGWMNDANGLVYKDGEYHLYFQYNPYGSVWGNMHWGHSVSKDLMHWEHKAPVIARDSLGHIFSGSSVVDVENTAGYGAGAIIAFILLQVKKMGKFSVWLTVKIMGILILNMKRTLF